MTAVGWFDSELRRYIKICNTKYVQQEEIHIPMWVYNKLIEQARQMEMEKCIQDYNAGYDDAQCNHINDAENYANEQKYINNNE